MRSYEFGDVILIWFPQTGTPQLKRRPALVLRDLGDDDVIVAPITSVERNGPGDLKLRDWHEGGLLRDSWLRLGKIATLEKPRIERRLGKVTDPDRDQIVTAWHSLFTFQR